VTVDALKDAVRKGRGWVAFEAFGSPVGMNFYADLGANRKVVGETGIFVDGASSLTVKLPTLHEKSPQKDKVPEVILRLYRVTSSGRELVSEARDKDLVYPVTQTGVYRAVVSIVPRHLHWFMDFKAKRALEEQVWVITNPIYIE
jgi:hypothetical protein